VRTLCAAVLTFESIIVLLAIPVAIVVYGLTAPVGIIGGGVLMIACLLIAGSQKRTWGLTAGWVLQVLIIATGFIVPAMFFLGVVFAIMWFYAIRIGRQGDAIKAARQAQQSAT
jgi:hypothetical protein